MPVRVRWLELTIADRALRELKAEISAIKNSATWSKEHGRSKVKQLRELAARIEQLEQDSRITTTLDEKFTGYWRNYQEMASDAAKRPISVRMPDGSIETNMDWVVSGLREQIINAIRRLRGCDA
jgi:hypothetical protein